jgi:hypothetical protein
VEYCATSDVIDRVRRRQQRQRQPNVATTNAGGAVAALHGGALLQLESLDFAPDDRPSLGWQRPPDDIANMLQLAAVPTADQVAALPAAHDERRVRPVAVGDAIVDQGKCGSCWAFTAARVFSDRLNRASAGRYGTGPARHRPIRHRHGTGPLNRVSAVRYGTGPALGSAAAEGLHRADCNGLRLRAQVGHCAVGTALDRLQSHGRVRPRRSPPLRRDCTRRCPHLHRTGLTPATSAPGLGSPLSHRHRDCARGTALGLPQSHVDTWRCAAHSAAALSAVLRCIPGATVVAFRATCDWGPPRYNYRLVDGLIQAAKPATEWALSDGCQGASPVYAVATAAASVAARAAGYVATAAASV